MYSLWPSPVYPYVRPRLHTPKYRVCSLGHIARIQPRLHRPKYRVCSLGHIARIQPRLHRPYTGPAQPMYSLCSLGLHRACIPLYRPISLCSLAPYTAIYGYIQPRAQACIYPYLAHIPGIGLFAYIRALGLQPWIWPK